MAEYPSPRALRRYGFNVQRELFDEILLRRAQELGVQVLEKSKGRRIVFRHDRAVGVEVQQPNGALQVLTSCFIVDASGRRCLVGKQLDLVEHQAARRQCAMYARFHGVESP